MIPQVFEFHLKNIMNFVEHDRIDFLYLDQGLDQLSAQDLIVKLKGTATQPGKLGRLSGETRRSILGSVMDTSSPCG